MLTYRRPRILAVVVLMLASAGLGSCGQSNPGKGRGADGRVQVLAAENFWGSIAARLGGDRVDVRSIVVNPSADPHSYEPTARDAREMAGSKLAIVNGIGYDNWAGKLLGASPASGRVVLNVGQLLGLKDGDNPHQWYSPSSVEKVIGGIEADYVRIDPGDAEYFVEKRKAFEAKGLARYDELRAEIRGRYAGTKVGYSESIFRPLGEDLGLELLTPYSFAKAVAEGTDVTAKDKETVDMQASNREMKVWVVNTQNVTPDVARVSEIARAEKIPTATITETLDPAGDTFEHWQTGELEGLLKALHGATGR
jgi:zinc/manganese transport system substrate-binding protein